MNKLKTFLIFILCICLSGCGYKNNDITLRFSTWGSASEMGIIKPIIADFEKQNPNIKIELVHIPQDYFKKLHLLFASNLAPDIIFINNLNIPVYKNFLTDLTDYVDKDAFYSQAIEGMSENNELYAVPRDVSTLVVYYNKDLFKKYGVKYPNQNWDLEDLISSSQKLTTNKTWGISFEPKMYYALPFVNYYKGNVLEDDIKSKNAINSYKELAYKYHSAPTPSEVGSKTLAQMFLENKIAMHISGRWLVPKYRECANFNWDVVNFPHWSATSDTSGWAVSKSTKHIAEAIKFILFISNKENIEKISSDGLIVPARKDVAESKTFLKGTPRNSKTFIDSVKKSSPTKVTKDYVKTMDLLNDKYFAIFN